MTGAPIPRELCSTDIHEISTPDRYAPLDMRSRSLLLLILVGLLWPAVIPGSLTVLAQTEVDRAADRADRADAERAEAQKTVDSWAARRGTVQDQIVAALFALEQANTQLEQTTFEFFDLQEQILTAETRIRQLRNVTETRAIEAYMNGTASGLFSVWSASNFEQSVLLEEAAASARNRASGTPRPIGLGSMMSMTTPSGTGPERSRLRAGCRSTSHATRARCGSRTSPLAVSASFRSRRPITSESPWKSTRARPCWLPMSPYGFREVAMSTLKSRTRRLWGWPRRQPALGIEAGAPVRLISKTGRATARVSTSERIQRGLVRMVGRGSEGSPAAVLDLLLDPVSKAPEEICAVRIERV